MTDAAFKRHVKWFEKNLRIVTKKGALEPFKLNRIQLSLERWKAECFEKKKPAWAIVLKARQGGVSTWSEGTFFRDSLEMPHRKSLVVAHKEESTRAIFNMTRRFHKYFPEELKTEKSSARNLHFAESQSEFSIQTAGSEEDAARSLSCQALHVSELDYCPNPILMLDAALQVIGDEYPSVIILESTAAGPGGAMEYLWNRAVSGRSEFTPFFFPWFDEPAYTREITIEEVQKYAPEEWKRKNRQTIEAVAKREGNDESVGRQRSASAERSERSGKGRSKKAVRRADEENPGDQQSGEHPDAPGKEGLGGTGRVSGVPSDQREADHGPDKVSRETPTGGGPGGPKQVFREVRSGQRKPNRGRDRESLPVSDLKLTGLDLFKDSLSDYERDLIEEFKITLEQVCWRRYCLETKCSGDETTMKREYPARPEEAFEAASGAICSPSVLAKWAKDAEQSVPSRGSMIVKNENPAQPPEILFDHEDRRGKIEIYDAPRHGHRYVAGLDCANGVEGGDDTVASVLDAESGVQVAEYRAIEDPDIAVIQIEALAILFNKAMVAVEINGGYGLPFVRRLLDNNRVPIYERQSFNKVTRQYMKVPGWSTDASTRNLLVSNMRQAIRLEDIQIKSRTTINECRTLHEKRSKDVGSGKIEARPGCKDDGFFATGIAWSVCMELKRDTRTSEDERRKEKPFLKKLNDLVRSKKDGGAFAPKHIRGA